MKIWLLWFDLKKNTFLDIIFFAQNALCWCLKVYTWVSQQIIAEYFVRDLHTYECNEKNVRLILTVNDLFMASFANIV